MKTLYLTLIAITIALSGILLILSDDWGMAILMIGITLLFVFQFDEVSKKTHIYYGYVLIFCQLFVMLLLVLNILKYFMLWG